MAGATDAVFDSVPVTHPKLLDARVFKSGIVVEVYGPKAS